MSNTQQQPDSYGYQTHARLIGGVPTAGEDLFMFARVQLQRRRELTISSGVIFGFVYLGLAAGSGWRWFSKRTVDKLVSSLRYIDDAFL